jgi:hypothetical protein
MCQPIETTVIDLDFRKWDCQQCVVLTRTVGSKYVSFSLKSSTFVFWDIVRVSTHRFDSRVFVVM